MRILAGLVTPSEGSISVLGVSSKHLMSRASRRMFGLVPSGDRTFYLRLSGLENLTFFGRLHGLRRAEAIRRGMECIEAVDLAEVARKPVGDTRMGCRSDSRWHGRCSWIPRSCL